MACATCGGVLDCFCPGRRGATATMAAAPPAGALPHGIVPRVSKGATHYDLVAYPDRLVLAHVPGMRAEIAGAVIGMVGGVLLAIVGAAIGSRIDAARNQARIEPLRRMTAELVLRSSPRNIGAATSRLRGIAVRSEGKGGRVTLHDAAGGRVKLKWHGAHTKGIDVPAALAGTFGPLVTVSRQSPAARAARLVATGLALAVVVIATIVGIAIAVTGSAADEATDPGTAACIDFYGEAAALGDQFFYHQLAPAAARAAVAMSTVATEDPAWQPTADSLYWLAQNLPATETNGDPAFVAEVERHIAVVDTACGAT